MFSFFAFCVPFVCAMSAAAFFPLRICVPRVVCHACVCLCVAVFLHRPPGWVRFFCCICVCFAEVSGDRGCVISVGLVGRAVPAGASSQERVQPVNLYVHVRFRVLCVPGLSQGG